MRNPLLPYVRAVKADGHLYGDHAPRRSDGTLTRTISVGGVRLPRIRLQAAICSARWPGATMGLPPRAARLEEPIREAVREVFRSA